MQHKISTEQAERPASGNNNCNDKYTLISPIQADIKLPTIATAIGANHRVIEDGVSGTLVNTDADWKKALEKYILKPDLRKAHGIKARERVEALYSIKANEPVYLEVINKVIGSK